MTAEIAQIVRKAADVLKAEGAKEVFVFGSAANGSLRPDSDIDLAVAGLPPERFYRAMGKAADALGRSVDLIDLDESTPFTRHLTQEGELQRVG